MTSTFDPMAAALLGALVLGACHAPAPENPEPTAAADSAPAVAPRPTAKPAAARWWDSFPIPTAVDGAKGCTVSGFLTGLALSVDGTAEGIFLPGASGARGEVVVAPGGRSAARVTLGAAVFNTGLCLEESTFMLNERPPPLGGILHVFDGASFRVIWGDATRLQIEPTGFYADGITWEAPLKMEVGCAGLGRRQTWPLAPSLPQAKKEVAPTSDAVAISAQKNGPIVARVKVKHAAVLEIDGEQYRIAASMGGVGLVIGWSSASAWIPYERPSPKPFHGGMGSGALRGPRLICPLGAPLLVRLANQLYAVGHLHEGLDASADAPGGPRRVPDWRFVKDGLRLEGSFETVPESVPWFVLKDDFRVTNHFWHEGERGSFLVPKGPGGCQLEE